MSQSCPLSLNTCRISQAGMEQREQLLFVYNFNKELEKRQLNTLNRRRDIQWKKAETWKELKHAESQIIKMVQSEAFPEDIHMLKEAERKKQDSKKILEKTW